MLFLFLYAYLRAVAPAGVRELPAGADLIRRERERLGPWTPGQRSVALAFGITVALWVTPGVVAVLAGEASPLYQGLTHRLPEGVAALLGAAALFVLPGKDGPAMTWTEATQIDWGVVLLYGGGFALGVLSFQTGLAEAMGRGLTGLLPVEGRFGLLVASVVFATILSETTSNTASANMVVPVVISIALAVGDGPAGARDRRDPGIEPRLHAAGLDTLQCDRLRIGTDPAGKNDPLGTGAGPGGCGSHRRRGQNAVVPDAMMGPFPERS